MTDIGPGDVVEAVADMDQRYAIYVDGPLPRRGDRAIVTELGRSVAMCSGCHQRSGLGLRVDRFPLVYPMTWWCTCEWRKIGGSRDDTVRKVQEELGRPRWITEVITDPEEVEKIINPRRRVDA